MDLPRCHQALGRPRHHELTACGPEEIAVYGVGGPVLHMPVIQSNLKTATSN